jgi:glutamyl-tRNA synthetase
VAPEALLGLLAWSCGWVGRVQPIAAADLVPRFRLDTIPPTPFVLSPELLRSIGYSSCSPLPSGERGPG